MEKITKRFLTLGILVPALLAANAANAIFVPSRHVIMDSSARASVTNLCASVESFATAAFLPQGLIDFSPAGGGASITIQVLSPTNDIVRLDANALRVDSITLPDGRDISRTAAGLPNFSTTLFWDSLTMSALSTASFNLALPQFPLGAPCPHIKGSIGVVLSGGTETFTVEIPPGTTNVQFGPLTMAVSDKDPTFGDALFTDHTPSTNVVMLTCPLAEAKRVQSMTQVRPGQEPDDSFSSGSISTRCVYNQPPSQSWGFKRPAKGPFVIQAVLLKGTRTVSVPFAY